MPMIRASAPGSFMVLGEHAVLHGHPAMVSSADVRLTVTLIPRTDGRVVLVRDGARHEGPWPGIGDHPAFRFVLASLKHAGLPEGGAELRFESEMPDTVGLGSSAAATVATLAAVQALDGTVQTLDGPAKRNLFEAARDTIRAVQGAGSGADAAASVFGGLVALEDGVPRRLPTPLPEISLVYCGYKTPTPEVIRRVEAHLEAVPALRSLIPAMGDLTRQAIVAAEAGDGPALGRAMDAYQSHLDALGMNTPELEAIVHALRGVPGMLGAKISGSGLGDCALGLGVRITEPAPGQVLRVGAGRKGVRYEPIA